MKGRPAAILALLVLACPLLCVAQAPAPRDFGEALPFAPRTHIVPRTRFPLTIDGRLAEEDWQDSNWTSEFMDIAGDPAKAPPGSTRVKMLWDEHYFYFAATLQEAHLWATLRERDSVIYFDNDFEIFLDPDGDTYNYFELEINALGTVWDLFLVAPYRDQNQVLNGWDIRGLKSAVTLDGTLNDSTDVDRSWTVEVGIPWAAIHQKGQGKAPPPGEEWRLNFSRVHWQLVADGKSYRKRIDPATGKPFPETNWVWSPQGAIDMHFPERWGFVRFSSQAPREVTEWEFSLDPNERVKWALRLLYYRQWNHRRAHGEYLTDLDALNPQDIEVPGLEFKPVLEGTRDLYVIRAAGVGGQEFLIRHDGLIRRIQ